jgi:hypothetical protein
LNRIIIKLINLLAWLVSWFLYLCERKKTSEMFASHFTYQLRECTPFEQFDIYACWFQVAYNRNVNPLLLLPKPSKWCVLWCTGILLILWNKQSIQFWTLTHYNSCSMLVLLVLGVLCPWWSWPSACGKYAYGALWYAYTISQFNSPIMIHMSAG